MEFAFLWVAACARLGGGDVPTVTVARGPMDVVLAVRGELEAVRSVTLDAPDLGGQAKVTWVIDDGTRVSQGDVLVKFDQTELQDHVDKARDDLQVAETKIAQNKAALEVKLADLQHALDTAQLSLERAQMRLTDSDSVPRVERESAKLDVKEQTIALERAQAAIESARLDNKAQQELLELDAEKAKRQVDTAEQARHKADLTAPAPGLVVLKTGGWGNDGRPTAPGDSVWGGQPLIELPDLSEMRVRAWVDEVDSSKVALGEAVEIAVDSHPDPKHHGTIEKIADLAVARNHEFGPKQLQVQISLDQTTPDLKPGLTVRAEIQVAHEDDVISVPREALFYDGETAHVFVQSFRGWAARTVTVGRTNDCCAAVTDGLAEGDVVALVDPTSDRPPPAGKPAAPPSP